MNKSPQNPLDPDAEPQANPAVEPADDRAVVVHGVAARSDETLVARPERRGPALAPALGTAMTMDSTGADLGSAHTLGSLDGADTADGPLGRFSALGLLGVGGMGEVLRVHDPMLHRSVALKLLTTGRGSAYAVSRFREEAQLTAQLQHPGIVPVYEFGMLADGRVYYTMQEVRGRTLGAVIDDAHRDTTAGAPALRRLVDMCHQACETVAYAHSKGVVHRDLKPANIMIGEFGEVRVMDWGIAKALGHAETPLKDVNITSSRIDDGLATRAGEIMGTPMYMAPEQARGELGSIGPATDVFALGAVLFRAISGEFPYARSPGFLQAVQAGQVQRLRSPFPLSKDLREIVERALAAKVSDRFPDAMSLARALGGWLEGARQRSIALNEVREAEARISQIAGLRERARALRAEARRMLAPLEPYTAVEAKRAAWDLEARALSTETEAEQAAADREERLRLALHHAPDLPEAHAALATLHAERHRAFESKRDHLGAVRYEARLRTHVVALPLDHPVRASLSAYLDGQGTLSLRTDPPQLEASLYRLHDQDRRRVEVLVRSLGRTPLVEEPVPHGDYVVVLKNRGSVRYPVRVERLVHWDGAAPGLSEPPIVMIPTVPNDEVLIPAGMATLGEPAEPVWVDGFVMRRRPVSNAEYLDFINGLVTRNRTDDAVQYAPKSVGAVEGYSWQPDHPATWVTWTAAQAYAEWRAERDRLPWRLPTEVEWEKAARGVDGRRYPWGDAHDPTWCRMRDSQSGQGGVVGTDDVAGDVSPYGVMGLGGNVRDWVVDWFNPGQKAKRVARGGAFSDDASGARCSARHPIESDACAGTIGFRLVRSL